MFRALRSDKLAYCALEAALRHTLFCQWDRIPTLRMISVPAERIRERAENFCARVAELRTEVIPGLSVIGGGATPEQALPTWLVAITADDVEALERQLRASTPPVIARIEEDRLMIDLRTVFDEEEQHLLDCLLQAAGSYARSR
jgi:L-seryl-tRNA(Ser) seleniumtransferase